MPRQETDWVMPNAILVHRKFKKFFNCWRRPLSSAFQAFATPRTKLAPFRVFNTALFLFAAEATCFAKVRLTLPI
jgi:hypothetical protein